MESKTKILSLLILCLLIPIASASSIELNPESFNIELIGGESYTQNFIAEWDGEAEVVGHLNYSVTEANGTYNGSELWLNFSENPVILEPNKPKQLNFTINTIPNIYPDIYSIVINISIEVEQEVVRQSGGSGRRRTSYQYIDIPENTTVDNITITDQQLLDYINITQEDRKLLLNILEKLNQSNNNLTETISILQNQLQIANKKANMATYLIIINLIIIIVGMSIFLYKKLKRAH